MRGKRSVALAFRLAARAGPGAPPGAYHGHCCPILLDSDRCAPSPSPPHLLRQNCAPDAVLLPWLVRHTCSSPPVQSPSKGHAWVSSAAAAADANKVASKAPSGSPHEVAGEGLSDSAILHNLVGYLWPADKPEHKRRVLGALGLLVGSKVLNVQVSPWLK